MYLKEKLYFTSTLSSHRQASAVHTSKSACEGNTHASCHMGGAGSLQPCVPTLSSTLGGGLDGRSLDRKRGRPSWIGTCSPRATVLTLSAYGELYKARRIDRRALNGSGDPRVISTLESLLSCSKTITDTCPPRFAVTFRIYHDYSQIPKSKQQSDPPARANWVVEVGGTNTRGKCEPPCNLANTSMAQCFLFATWPQCPRSTLSSSWASELQGQEITTL